MLKRMTLALILGLWLSAPVFPQPNGGGPKTQFEKVYRQLKELKAGSRGARVKGLVLKRDAATITLREGQLFLCPPIDGFSCAAVFKGKGNIVFVPPSKVERQQIARFYQNDSINRDFSELFLMAADGTLEELQQHLQFENTESPEDFGPVIDEAVKYITYHQGLKGDYCQPGIMKTILEKQPNGLFYAHVRGPGYRSPDMFGIDPYSFEEVEFYAPIKEVIQVGYRRDLISKFPRQMDSTQAFPDEFREPLSIVGYQMDCWISGGERMDVACRMEVRSHLNNNQWLYFDLASGYGTRVAIDSMTMVDGQTLEYYKGNETATFWVKAPQPLARGQVCTLSVFYHGDFLKRIGNWIYLTSSIGWYPQDQLRDKADFNVTYHYPSKFRLVSVGEPAGSGEKDDITTSRWVSKTPVRSFTFNLGFFKEQKIKDNRIPPLSILATESSQGDLQKIYQEMNRDTNTSHVVGIAGKNMMKQIGADVANSMAFFQQAYGPCPVSSFYTIECLNQGGEAFPGMINLSPFTYYSTSSRGEDEVLRAHEVAHQWWAFGVDFKTYHDQWLSEGLSEFSGLWYMQMALKDNKKYFQWFSEYGDSIINNRKQTFLRGRRSGPIWLGYRNESSETQNDYNIMIYQKGAWVIQMLRNMMIDLNTMKEDKFTGMMHDYYATYCDSQVTTEQFRRMAEKHTGMDMGWFFDQWVYGTDIPSYKYSYRTEQAPGGRYRVTLRVRQEEVSPDFMMYVPLQIDFGENRQARLRVLVKGPLTELELPLMPLKPKDIEFNPYQSVLCRQDKEGF